MLDEAGVLGEADDDSDLLAVDDATIDETVQEFRSFLDDVDPAQFALEDPADADDTGEQTDPSGTVDTDSDDQPDPPVTGG